MTGKRALGLFLLNLVGFGLVLVGVLLFAAPAYIAQLSASPWPLLAWLPMVAVLATYADWKTGARR